MDVVVILLAIGLILFFGQFAEFIFRKLSIPDVLFLILLGFILGPNVLGYVSPGSLAVIAPVFTTFTLLFLIFDGAFNIHLASLIRELSHSLVLTLFNFFISSAIIMAVLVIAGFPWLISLLAGFILGGVSSSFVIPILKEIKISERLFSLLTLESALTDVFCIVFSLTVIEIIRFGSFGVKAMVGQLISLFAVAGFIGMLAGVIWIVLSVKVFKNPNYMITIAYLLIVYALTDFLGGNGAIAALFFGLMLKNSKQLTAILHGITKKVKSRKKKIPIHSVIRPSEEFFYHQVSFLLKTFFFVYIGILIDIQDWKALLIGVLISFVLMGSRIASSLLTKKMEPDNRSLVNAIFARGLAAAVIVQLVIEAGIMHADFIAKVTYVVITGTIVLSSVRVFLVKRKMPVAVVKK